MLKKLGLMLLLATAACDLEGPVAPGAENYSDNFAVNDAALFAAVKQCRTSTGKFAPCRYTCWDGSRVYYLAQCPPKPPTPTPTPTPPPPVQPPAPPAPPPVVTVSGVPPIVSNFDVNLALSFGHGIPPVQPASEDVGAFRFICGAGQLHYDDPLVYPGQPGKSHLHQFYGNTAANGNSTFASLRASGDSTCNNTGKGIAANRSAYWMPAMLDGKGNVIQPDFVQTYYKQLAADKGMCSKYPDRCVPIPNGLRFIFGYDMINNVQAPYPGHYQCEYGGSVTVPTKTIAEQVAYCKAGAGAKFEAVIDTPKCWDGKNLDSPDHRSHLNYNMVWDADGVTRVCPASHPYLIPQFTLGVHYSFLAGDDLTQWRLSSDEMHPELPHGSTFHADYWEAWDVNVKLLWQNNCINKRLNCSAGELGNGTNLLGAGVPAYGWVNPKRLVPVPVN